MRLSKLQYKFMFRMVNSYLYNYPILPELFVDFEERITYERNAENHHSTKKIRCSRSDHAVLIIYGNGMKEICAVTCDNENDFRKEEEFTIHLTDKWRWWYKAKDREEAEDEVIHITGIDNAFEQIEKLCDKAFEKCRYDTPKRRMENRIKSLEKRVALYETEIGEAKKALRGL